MQLLKRGKADFLNGPILSRILTFALPIFLGMVFQQAYSMVDSVVVGKYVSADALAAVGSTGTISMLLVGVMMGFPMGASIVAAQFLGAGQKDKIKSTIATTLWFLLALSLILSIAGLIFSSQIMRWVKVDPKIYADTVKYFRIYILGMVFMALYNFFSSFLRALGDSTTPLIFLIASSVLNILGDLFFVLVLDMGVAGVAWATVLAQAISVAMCAIYVRKTSEYFSFKKSELRFDGGLFKKILRLGLPSSLQSSITGFGMVMVQTLINSSGAINTAAYTVAARMEQLCNLPMSGIAMSLSLFIGQNVGAGNYPRVKRGMLLSAACSVGLSMFMSIVILLFGDEIMRLFVKREELTVITVGAAFMRRWAPLVFLHGLFECVVSTLRGAGDSIHAMISMFFDLIMRTIMAYIFFYGFDIVILGVNLRLNPMGFMGIAWAIPCGWACCCVYSIIRYLTGGWKRMAVVDRE